MMKRLYTTRFRQKSDRGEGDGVGQLERVESLLVKHEQSRDGAEADDRLLGEGSSPIFNFDYYQDARRQVYNESLLFRNTAFYATKVHLEQRFDEHHLLRMHLEALERSERNGPVLMPDEFLFLESGESPGFVAAAGSAHGPVSQLLGSTVSPGPLGSGLQRTWSDGGGQAFPAHASGMGGSLGSGGTVAGSLQPGAFPGSAPASRVASLGTAGAVADRANEKAGVGGLPGAETAQICYVGGEPHALDWRAWVQRQRQRGWFTNEALFYMTVLGGIVGGQNFTLFWGQLQIWKSSMFFLPFAVFIFLVGLPTIQMEILMGNLFRGASIKQFSQISHKFVGAGILCFFSCLLRVVLIANRSAQLLVYFVASVKTPHPWELTAQDLHDCLILSGHKFQCEATMHGALCHYIDDEDVCMASPTGKATYYYLKELQPSAVDPSINPDKLQGKYIATVAVVWLYILAYIWRGLFKLGFLSAILMFVAGVLCVTLMMVCFLGDSDSGRDIGAVFWSTFDIGQLFSSFKMSHLTSAVIQCIFDDLSLGYGIFGTVGSFTKIGYNAVPSVAYATFVNCTMSLVAFAALLAAIGSIKAETGVSVNHLVSKTRGATAYFVIFPAAFTRVSVPNVFAMFLFGGIFVLNTQVAAVSINSMINMVAEARVCPKRHRKLVSIVLVIICFLFSIPFCGSNQQVRVDYFRYLMVTFLNPVVILLEAIALGWFHNYRLQIRIAGKKAYLWHLSASWIFTVVYIALMVILAGSWSSSILVIPVVNSALAALFAFIFKEPQAAPDFATRFWALWLGNIETFRRDVCRVTLFPPRSIRPADVFLSFLKRLFCCCCSTGPFFLCRPSMYWSFCIRYVVPGAAFLPVLQGLTEFDMRWSSMAPSANLRNSGLALVVVAYAAAALIIFIPQVHWWLCPPAEDYMPIKMFPHHPYKPPPATPLTRSISRLFQEFLTSSTEMSPHLTGLVADCRMQHQRQTQLLRETALAHHGDGSEAYRGPGGSLPDMRVRGRSYGSNDGSDIARRPVSAKPSKS
ncbi:Sodium:neurotransmitter symporter family protein [Toxoplasma gondii ME49]|uniref:Sodium:neurotransmitter symporter family protein n=7 Tax=Toxoplasma gondii TaxID=5811 RepID=B6KP52_TOXGV|nr:Sodium:neurotransmitter symporter family protein [Toxoplasma gondii ME49]ESS29427.1 Sodium:neurotransmitter symporter family protein [Toxoplasma gondii VEG]KYF41348.1 Sodium:neurotransmitter symporter family protein [Toxoplasma gondii ARI]PIL98555.1 Sodium:neurotransmitter symporter family protein [Toxoplasma gondii COUG]EPT32392.1 Sodium:neurotransmitter symporter family protein [Toxoplasma gondii ME49]CEL71680.1 TPA: transporter, putative [Toxoplasma gondii VEG]|eukprot:XP_002369625.1 Sodium:neurotransmitter symporter family protein [Toxoplasma gondii ME49]